MTQSISQRLAGFVASLTYDSLPPKVVDKLKALTLHGLVVSIAGADTPQGRLAIKLIKEEEAREAGATILVDGTRATRMGAVFANSKLMHVTSQSDSYRMLTHPGPCVIPPALATAEMAGSSGADFLTALAAGYEVETRLASDFIPTTQARGFRSSPVYGVFGAAMATGKLLGLTESQLAHSIALAATFAGGTGEGPRTEGQESTIHEANTARNGIMAALLAREGVRGAVTSLEGEAGFYSAFTGNNRGELSYVFEGPMNSDPNAVADALGERYFLMDVTPKIYPTAGYNNPLIQLMAQLKAEHSIQADQVNEITLEMNWLETLYPSPAFPNQRRAERRVGSTHYFVAYTCVHGDYPTIWDRSESSREPGADDPRVLDLMERVSVVGQKDRRSYASRITVRMKSGNQHQGELTGEELKWGMETVSRRIVELFDGLPLPKTQLDELVSTASTLEDFPRIDPLVRLCVA